MLSLCTCSVILQASTGPSTAVLLHHKPSLSSDSIRQAARPMPSKEESWVCWPHVWNCHPTRRLDDAIKEPADLLFKNVICASTTPGGLRGSSLRYRLQHRQFPVSGLRPQPDLVTSYTLHTCTPLYTAYVLHLSETSLAIARPAGVLAMHLATGPAMTLSEA